NIGTSGSAFFWFLNVTTTNGGNWLVVTPQNGQANAAGTATTTPPVSVSVNPSGLAPGTYTGQISVMSSTATNSPQTVNVTLIVSNQPILNFENSGTTFNYQFSSATVPPPQTVQLTSSGNPLPFTVSTTPVTGGAFLSVTPTSGTTPQRLTFSL